MFCAPSLGSQQCALIGSTLSVPLFLPLPAAPRSQKGASRTGKRARVDDADKENSKKNGWGGDTGMALESVAAVTGSCGRIVEMEEELDTRGSKFEE